jgi:hypothetical protein
MRLPDCGAQVVEPLGALDAKPETDQTGTT